MELENAFHENLWIFMELENMEYLIPSMRALPARRFAPILRAPLRGTLDRGKV